MRCCFVSKDDFIPATNGTTFDHLHITPVLIASHWLSIRSVDVIFKFLCYNIVCFESDIYNNSVYHLLIKIIYNPKFFH